MEIYGTFLCIATDVEPEVHLLGADQFARLNERLALADKRESTKARQHAMRLSFGRDFVAVVPCWSQEAMERLALEYVGPHEKRVRHLAACIVLGEPFGGEAGIDGMGKPDDPPPDGGLKVKSAKPKPKKPPGGAAASLSDIFAEARS